MSPSTGGAETYHSGWAPHCLHSYDPRQAPRPTYVFGDVNLLGTADIPVPQKIV
jgi:hypothetical protein